MPCVALCGLNLAPEWPPRAVRRVRIISLSWSPVTESNRRPSPYHACWFRLMGSHWVGLPQVGVIAASGCVVFRLPLPGVVVTYFVTGSRTTFRQANDRRSWRARVRHNHGAMTCESGAVTRVRERALLLPVKVGPPRWRLGPASPLSKRAGSVRRGFLSRAGDVDGHRQACVGGYGAPVRNASPRAR